MIANMEQYFQQFFDRFWLSVNERIYQFFADFWLNIQNFLVDISYNVALIGGGLLILLHVLGHEKAVRWLGTLIMAYALIQYIFG